MTAERSEDEAVTMTGRRVLVSGGTTGIGRAIAVRLASEGARVFVCGRSDDHLHDALAEIRAVGEGDGMTLDLADEDGPRRFFDAGIAALGGIDVAVVNAAVAAGGLTQESEDKVRYAIAVNFTGYLISAKLAAEAMTGPGSDGGDIVLIGSMSTYALGPSSTVYAGIKYGIQGFAVALRRELGPQGVRVALIEPSLTQSNMIDLSAKEQAERIAQDKMLRAQDIAAGVHYVLTQPRRVVIQRLDITPRAMEGE